MSRTSSRLIPRIFRIALECGSLLPLYPRELARVPPRRVESISRSAASELACSKAAASRRTPKQRAVARAIKNLWSPSPEPATGLRSFRNYGLTAPEATPHPINHSYSSCCVTWWRRKIFATQSYPCPRNLHIAFVPIGVSSPQDGLSGPTFVCLSIISRLTEYSFTRDHC